MGFWLLVYGVRMHEICMKFYGMAEPVIAVGEPVIEPAEMAEPAEQAEMAEPFESPNPSGGTLPSAYAQWPY